MNKMGVTIYNEVDLQRVRQAKAAALAGSEEAIDSLANLAEQNMVTQEAIASIFETNVQQNIQTSDALATMFETILSLHEEVALLKEEIKITGGAE